MKIAFVSLGKERPVTHREPAESVHMDAGHLKS
jgi:hypothetical protein